MKRVVNIAVDIETLSKRSTAAIIGIAAKPFSLGSNTVVDGSALWVPVDATSCAMYGLDFDPATVKWWSERPEEVKKQFNYPCSLWYALRELETFISNTKKNNDADDVVIWCQGSDFDIPILRNAFVEVNNDREEKTVPWKYTNVRDARTFIYESVRLINPEAETPYSAIPNNHEWRKHDAQSDCDQLIHNVTWVYKKLHEIFERSK